MKYHFYPPPLFFLFLLFLLLTFLPPPLPTLTDLEELLKGVSDGLNQRSLLMRSSVVALTHVTGGGHVTCACLWLFVHSSSLTFLLCLTRVPAIRLHPSLLHHSTLAPSLLYYLRLLSISNT